MYKKAFGMVTVALLCVLLISACNAKISPQENTAGSTPNEDGWVEPQPRSLSSGALKHDGRIYLPVSEGVYSIKTDGSDGKMVVEGINIDRIMIQEGYLYYTNTVYPGICTITGKEVGRINLDGTDNRVVDIFVDLSEDDFPHAWMSNMYYDNGQLYAVTHRGRETVWRIEPDFTTWTQVYDFEQMQPQTKDGRPYALSSIRNGYLYYYVYAPMDREKPDTMYIVDEYGRTPMDEIRIPDERLEYAANALPEQFEKNPLKNGDYYYGKDHEGNCIRMHASTGEIVVLLKDEEFHEVVFGGGWMCYSTNVRETKTEYTSYETMDIRLRKLDGTADRLIRENQWAIYREYIIDNYLYD
ncbi:DUF5050 domain-containing protein [Eubacteriales bacterium OttesenSCG-928-N14]|nr:DUF5050 domain-containing protein [Eubacteriales bacterium OttesenSCG-928-N14]